jgi:hypothetical protein
MRKFICAAAAITFGFVAPAGATYFNATYDCGGGRTIWVANPVEGHGAERERKLIIKMSADFDRPVVVRWDPDKDAVTFNGRHCRRAND